MPAHLTHLGRHPLRPTFGKVRHTDTTAPMAGPGRFFRKPITRPFKIEGSRHHG